MAGAVGSEVLSGTGQIANGLFKLGETIQNRKDKEAAVDLKKQQMAQQQQAQQQKNLYKGLTDLHKDYNFDRFATGDSNLDKQLAPQFDAIMQKSEEMMNNGDIMGGTAYAYSQTLGLGKIHSLASNAIKNANNDISALQKQDPNIDISKLRSDVYNQISSQFVNKDGTLLGANELQNVNIPDNLAGQLVDSGNYYSSGAPATSYFAKQKVNPFESAYHNGLGGGDTIKGGASVYKPIVQDANGNYVPTTVSESVDLGNGHSAQVFPADMYSQLPANVQGGITYMYNQQANDAKSQLYTNPASPLYGTQPTDNPHPITQDLGKRWIARNIADQVSPSYVNKMHNDNRQSIRGTGGASGGTKSTGKVGDADAYYDTFHTLASEVPDNGNVVTVNNFSPTVQKYIGDILYSSGAGLSNSQAGVKWNDGKNRYELVDAKDGSLIAPLSAVETNLSTNSKAAKTRRAVMDGTTNPRPKSTGRLTPEETKEGLKHLGVGRFNQPPKLETYKRDKDGRIDLREMLYGD